MNITISVAIITGAFTIINSFITYRITRYNFKEPKINNILEKQYENVFAPLHKIIFYQKGLSQDEMKSFVAKLISDQYLLVPPEIVDAFNKSDECLCNRLIEKAYNGARSRLGYTQYKQKLDIETKKLLGIISDSDFISILIDILVRI